MASCGQSVKNEAVQESQKLLTASIEELVAQPAEFQDKAIALSGMVTHVCRHGGQKCFVLAEDGETQLRIVPGEGIDEFGIDLEGSTVAFKGTFRMMTAEEADAHVDEHHSHEHHAEEMAHSTAEKADIFLEATDFQEITQ
jgi:hypothetical protein